MSSTKEAIIQLGDELIRRKGYNAFSYSDIAKALNVKNAAIHYHFPTKPDLALGVVHWHTESFNRFVKKCSDKNELLQVKMFLNFYTSIQLSGKVCIIGALATDWNSMEPHVKEKVTEFTDGVIEWISKTLGDGKEKNLLTFYSSEKIEAIKILTNMFAGAQLARITGNEDFTGLKNSIIEQITK